MSYSVITYNKIGYPVRTVVYKGIEFDVAGLDLRNILLHGDDEPRNTLAEGIDETIAYYLTPEEFQLSDKEIYELIYKD